MRLGSLRRLYGGKDNYASVYLDASRAAEDAAEAVALRWRAVKQRLSEAGADGATLSALEELVTGPGHPAPGLAAFATADAVVFAASLPHPPRREIGRYAPLPHLMPLLAQRPPQVPHVQVRADRAGGEVVAVRTPDDVTEPAEVAASEAELRERGVDQIAIDRADAAIVRAIAATDAELRFVPDGEQPPTHGIGALLRYPVPGV